MQGSLRSEGFLHQQSKLVLLDALQTLDVHNHIALIYETRAEQFDAVLPFLKTGLDRDEKCIYITDDNAVDEIVGASSNYDIEMEAAFESGALTVCDPSESYLRDGYFDPDEMFEYFAEEVAAAKRDGFTAVRAMGEMTWQLGGGVEEDLLLEYEARINRFLDDHDMLAICQYNRERFDPTLLKEVVRTHPKLVYGYTVAENHYYVPPDEYLDPDPGQELDRVLSNIVHHDRLRQRLVDREDQMKVLSTVLRHNIRNELGAIIGNVELLTESLDEPVREIEPILEAAERLVELSEKGREVEAVLDQMASVEPVDLEPLLEAVVRRLRSRYPDANVTVDVEEPVTVLALPTIGDAVEELICNGVKHNDRETPRVDVRVEREDASTAVDIVVADNGPGIPEMEVRTLTKEQEIEPLYHGSGLGLWLANWIVARSNGELSFDERDPRGSVVTIRLAAAGSTVPSGDGNPDRT